jgi:CheY-like chemotaxis protein
MDNKYAIIIEDNATDVNVLQGLLKQQGVSYTALFDSRTALGMLARLPRPDVFFLDLEMPGISGYDVIAFLQADPDLRDVPVVAYTSHLSHMNTAREAGFHSFLSKPLKRIEFAEQLEKILNNIKVWDGR